MTSTATDYKKEALSQSDLYQLIKKLLPVLEPSATGTANKKNKTEFSEEPVQYDKALIDDIRILGALLGQVICEHEGSAFYQFIERLRQASRGAREQSGEIGIETIHQLIAGELSAQINEVAKRSLLHRAVAAFRLFLLLAGIAEEFHQSQKYSTVFQGEPQGIVETIALSQKNGQDLKTITQLLQALSIRLVFTAHPTKILRQTILHHQFDIFYVLQAMHAPNLTGFAQQELLQELTEKIEVLWATQFSRWTKPEPQEETSRILSYLTRTIYPTLPTVELKLRHALKHFYPDKENQPLDSIEASGLSEPILSMGSWVGGDMDGNPFVTSDVFENAMIRQHQAILNLYIDDIQGMLSRLSHAFHRVECSALLRQSIFEDLENLASVKGSLANNVDYYCAMFEREPYRLKMTLIGLKLQETVKQFQLSGLSLSNLKDSHFMYPSAKALLDDLACVTGSLSCHGYQRTVDVHLDHLRKSIEIFGFHFASIDMREDTAHVNLAAQAVLKATHLALAITNKITQDEALLTEAILSKQSIFLADSLQSITLPGLNSDEQDAISRILSMLAVAKKAKSSIDPNACRHFILSMTSSMEDVLSALLLLKVQGLFTVDMESQLDIVPLFETIPDLQEAPAVMEALFKNPAYQQQLAMRQNKQLILVGYSDSNKDGGYFTSNWHIYKAQQELWNLAKRYDVKLRFFHGRGGNLGRGGGGSAQRAIAALPPETVFYGQDLTEQGEVISRYYNVPETAQARCENILSAVLSKNLKETSLPDSSFATAADQAVWSEIAGQLSGFAQEKYASLVHHNPNFLHYFEQVTPREVGLVKIGSRPSHRKQTQSIADLRAIPWVFRWFQSRQILPGWYGLGSALKQYAGKSSDVSLGNTHTTQQLQSMYDQWPFFQSVLENSEIILMQTDLSIARYYCTLAQETGESDKEAALAILADIESEYHLTRQMLSEITGKPLLSNPQMQTLKKTIAIKEPYLDPLNYIQVQLLKTYRKLERDEGADQTLLDSYHRVIVSSIEGIAMGLGTSG